MTPPKFGLWMAITGLMLAGCPKKVPKADAETLATNPAANFQQGLATLTPDRKGVVDYEGAYDYFKKATELNGGKKADYNAGWVAERLGSMDEAEAHYRSAYEADVEYEAAMHSLARVLKENGKADQVPDVYKAYLDAHPEDENARTQYMDALVGAGLDGEAIEQGREVLRKNPNNDAVYRSLSGLYFKQGRLEMAQIMGDKALALNDKDPDVYNNMGVVLLEQNRVPEAIDRFKQARHLDPTHYEANMNLGLLVLDSGDYNLALDCFDKALERNPTSADAKVGRAVSLRGQGDYDAAGKIYDELIKANPKQQVAYFNAATLHHKYTLNFTKALKYLDSYKSAHSGEIGPNDEVFIKEQAILAAKAKEEERKAAEAARKKAEEERKQRAAEALGAIQDQVTALQSRLESRMDCLPEDTSMEIGMIVETAVEVIDSKDLEMASEVKQMLDDYYLPMFDEAEAANCTGGGGEGAEGAEGAEGTEGAEGMEEGGEAAPEESGEMETGDEAETPAEETESAE